MASSWRVSSPVATDDAKPNLFCNQSIAQRAPNYPRMRTRVWRCSFVSRTLRLRLEEEVSALQRIKVWTSGVLLTVWALSGAEQTLPVEIKIVVYDKAHVGSKTLSVAESLAGRILSAAGLDARWTAGPISDLQWLGMDFTAPNQQECASASGVNWLRAQVLAHAPAGFPPRALGFSLPCATTGIQVTVYADRVAEVSEVTAPTFGRVLGYALVHELGHVLLHSSAHEDIGLMKSVWSKSDWQRAAVSNIRFSSSQSRQIIGAIPTRSTAIARPSPIARRMIGLR